MWLILLTGYYLFATVARLERRKLAVKYPEKNLAFLVLFFLFLVPTGIALSFFFPNNYSEISAGLFFYTVMGSIVWPVAGYVGYRANVLAGAGLFTIIGSLSPVVAVALSVTLLGEQLSAVSAVGIALILGSNVLLVNKINDGSHPDIKKGIVLCIVTALIVGIGATFEKSVLNNMELGSYLIIGWTAQAIWSFIPIVLFKDQIVPVFTQQREVIVEALPFAITGIIKSVFFLSALRIANASIVVPATNSLAVIVVVASYFILDEKDHFTQKMIAVCLGVVGLILLGVG